MKRLVLLVGIPVAALIVVAAFYLHGGRYAATDNAYVQSSLILISPEISGVVKDVAVHENQLVKAGDAILHIDDAPFKVALDRARAKLAQVQIDFASLKASYSEKQAEIDAAQTKYDFAQKAFVRQSSLAAKNVLSEQAMDDATQASELAKQQISQLQQDLNRITASLGGSLDTPLEKYPAYVSAQADLAQAQLDLAHTEMKAPTDGMVSKLPAAGQYETAGVAAFALVASANMRVDANFTETEITYVQAGQPVTVTVDTYPGVTFKGVVDSLSPATGAAFSVIPAQNATGNWVKIAQRVPVRIKLEPQADGPQLRVGMSASVSIDTGHKRSLGDLAFW
ncbi:MAG: HlyD family secretion protein [Alphaproteobacteria bacterium]|nr:HlyD family secretion protein [Alphaproteobacteria bacterium]